jgi:adenylate kinase
VRLILLGPPGVGKGTQGARLSQALGVPSVSTGALLRELIASGAETPLVQEARQILSGAFVSDSFANALAFSAIAGQPGFILDGYPRSLGQAEALERFLESQGVTLDAVLLLRLCEEALDGRVAGRRLCLGCGATYHVRIAPPRREGLCDRCGSRLGLRPEDDQPEKRRLRQQLYETQTAPLIAFYQGRGLLQEIDAEGLPEAVFRKVCESLRGLI